MITYDVITGRNKCFFVAEVNGRLREGWLLHGNTSTNIEDRTGHIYHSQAMILPDTVSLLDEISTDEESLPKPVSQ